MKLQPKQVAISAGIFRKLVIGDHIGEGATADDSILVIGDPACERAMYPRLMGARREATKVAECLEASTNGGKVLSMR